MREFRGQALSWTIRDRVIELALHRKPCNEFAPESLAEFERFAAVLPELEDNAHAVIIHSTLECGFSAPQQWYG